MTVEDEFRSPTYTASGENDLIRASCGDAEVGDAEVLDVDDAHILVLGKSKGLRDDFFAVDPLPSVEK